MELHEDRIGGREIFHGRVVNLKVDDVRLMDGSNSIREVVEHPGGVCVAALNDRDEVYLVRQYRYPFRTVLLELPAGKLEPGEVPLEAAKREQWEETGTRSDRYRSLGRCYATPGYCTEQVHLWACRVTETGAQHLDPGEFLELEAVPLERAAAMVLANEIEDAKTQVGILKTWALVKAGEL